MTRYLVEVPFFVEENGHPRSDYRFFAVRARSKKAARSMVHEKIGYDANIGRITAYAVTNDTEARLQASIADAKAQLPRREEKAEAPNSTLADCAYVMSLYRIIEDNEKKIAALAACK